MNGHQTSWQSFHGPTPCLHLCPVLASGVPRGARLFFKKGVFIGGLAFLAPQRCHTAHVQQPRGAAVKHGVHQVGGALRIDAVHLAMVFGMKGHQRSTMKDALYPF